MRAKTKPTIPTATVTPGKSGIAPSGIWYWLAPYRPRAPPRTNRIAAMRITPAANLTAKWLLGLGDDRRRLVGLRLGSIGGHVGPFRPAQRRASHANSESAAVSTRLTTIDVAMGAYTVHRSPRSVKSPGKRPTNGTLSANTSASPMTRPRRR